MDALYFVELFGGLRIFSTVSQSAPLTRFRTQKTAALLAYLAFYGGRQHSRETLIDMFWPDAGSSAGRTSLNVALSSLRAQLEAPHLSPGSVLITERASVGLTAAVKTDVAQFEFLLDQANSRANTDPTSAFSLFVEATKLFRRELLPGFYEDWILSEQERLTARAQEASHWLEQYTLRQNEPSTIAELHRRTRHTNYVETATPKAPPYEIPVGATTSPLQ